MKTFLLVAFLVFAFLGVEAQRAGTLDSSFGKNGISETGGTNSPVIPTASVLLSNNKILVLSNGLISNVVSNGIYKYLPDGHIDSTFGVSGFALLNGYDLPTSLTVQQDNKVVAVGITKGNFTSLTKFEADGTIDLNFGANGTFTDSTFTRQHPFDVKQQADGKLLICGNYLADYDRGTFYSLITRVNKDGSLDKTFGDEGHAINKEIFVSAFKMAIQSDGKIVCCAEEIYGAKLIRYNSNGRLDSSFGTNGIVFTHFSNYLDYFKDVVIQPDGKIVAIGTAQDEAFNGKKPYIIAARYSSDGTLDESFGQNGKTSVNYDNSYTKGTSVVIQQNGKIVVSGFTTLLSDASDICLSRLLANGIPDSSFGTNAKSVIAITSSSEESYQVDLQSDGKIIVSSLSNKGDDTYTSILARCYGDPVKQLSPIAKKIKRWIRNHTLNWQYNNADVDYFIIEQSSNSVTGFKEIAKVKSQNSKVKSDEQVYSYNLNAAANSRNYYRITAVSINGSKVVSTVVSDEDVISIVVSPNPVKDVLKISGLPVNQKAIINIINRNGNVLQSAVCNNSVCNMNVSSLHSGLYNVQVNVNGRLQSVKFVKE